MCLPDQILLRCDGNVHFIAKKGTSTNARHGEDACFSIRCFLIACYVDHAAKMPACLPHIPQRQWNRDAAFRHARLTAGVRYP